MKRALQKIALGLACLSVGACSSLEGAGATLPDVLFGGGMAAPGFVAGAGGEAIVVTRLSDGASGTFRLIAARDGVETWAAPDGSAFALRDGVMVSSFALGRDLYSADVSDVTSALRTGQGREITRVHRYLDGENEIVTRAFECTIAFAPPREAPALGERVRPVSERCKGFGTSFVNTYLLSLSGVVLGSEQWVGPDVGSVRFAPQRTRPVRIAPPILVPETILVRSTEVP